MGFRRPPLLVTFEPGDDLHGLEVRLRRLSVRQLLDVATLAEAVGTDQEEQSTWALVEYVAAAVVSWNLEDDDGVPVPTDAASFLDQDMVLILRIVGRWMDVADVPAPLDRPSNGGSPSPAASIPMETLLPNPLSLPTLS